MQVFRGIHIASGTTVALKLIERTDTHNETLSNMETEIIALSTTSTHRHIITLRDVLTDVAMHDKYCTIDNSHVAVVVTECCTAGRLFEYVAHSRFTECLARTYFQQLLSAVKYMHSRRVVHRDIKVCATNKQCL